MSLIQKQNRLLIFLKDKRKKPLVKMLKESLHLWILKKEIPYYYFKYIYRKGVSNYTEYIGTKEARRIQNSPLYHFNEHEALLNNKLMFSIYLSKNKISVPNLLAYNFKRTFNKSNSFQIINSKDDLIRFITELMNSSNQNSIFVKPMMFTYGGVGCHLLKKDTLIKDLDKHHKFLLSNNCIYQEVIKQHKDIDAINPYCLNTIRFETYIDINKKAHILSAFMRFGVGNSIVDNSSSGGYYVGIHLDNGTLKSEGHQFMQYGGATFTHHPDNNYKLKGFKIPFFEEAKNLVLNATNLIPDRYTGWDVGISQNGPILIEANIRTSIFGADIAYGGYLKHPLYQQILNETKK